MAPLLAEVRRRLGSYLYGTDVSGLEETALRLCQARGLTLSAAESCTGGLIAKRLTDIPGASQTFLGGVVSYTNTVKQHVLGVPASLLETYGAVSAPVARAMAMGVRVLTGSDLALSVTGLAGPAGDDRGSPVGTVFTAFPRLRAFSCGSWRWAAIGSASAPSPPTTRWTCCAAISRIK